MKSPRECPRCVEWREKMGAVMCPMCAADKPAEPNAHDNDGNPITIWLSNRSTEPAETPKEAAKRHMDLSKVLDREPAVKSSGGYISVDRVDAIVANADAIRGMTLPAPPAAREWWLCRDASYEVADFNLEDIEDLHGDELVAHVIERSAYDAVVRERDESVKTKNWLVKTQLPAFRSIIEKLQAENERLRECLDEKLDAARIRTMIVAYDKVIQERDQAKAVADALAKVYEAACKSARLDSGDSGDSGVLRLYREWIKK